MIKLHITVGDSDTIMNVTATSYEEIEHFNTQFGLDKSLKVTKREAIPHEDSILQRIELSSRLDPYILVELYLKFNAKVDLIGQSSDYHAPQEPVVLHLD